ncbi:aminoglycoside phosphotransferase family protein [Actinokineospora diospyrosa]|uniref:Kinase, aminoglycoside phosphotransferase (APT) family n=1 Tax=Actinokineospora diospyrosa TaxID=103728 RepID=A0ABT1IIW8_9PSEU|nr:aminoglycoside phosphotransferase family protein [Actinokineospora diospyrosa]MCP2272591.1 putative kinase, aminoglycoside phosphotransferase (APT) family [Actinokineospora diospyrosa]
MDETPDLGPLPKRISVEVEQVERLVADQFPQWGSLPIAPVAKSGWDNVTFHLGDSMLVRLPSAREYALAVDKEHEWLPVLAPSLPRPIPVPLAKGTPGAAYPFSWSVYEWIEGRPASFEAVADQIGLARDLADFILALQGIDASVGPQPGIHNWFRGATLLTYDASARDALATLRGHVDVELVQEIWKSALDSRWDGVDVWFHGDLAEGNLLLDNGALHAVIDFGTCGVGDPACDLAIAWTLLTAESRVVFRERLGINDALWSRGRGWALWKTLVYCANSVNESDAAAVNSRRVLDEILAEYNAR